MKYFYDEKSDSVFAFASDGSQNKYIPQGMKRISEEEAKRLANRPPKFSEEELDAMRKNAYMLEADPLFFKWQRGEISKQVWLDKVAEIKSRYK